MSGFMRDHLLTHQYESFQSFISKEPKIVLNILSTALSALELWHEPTSDISVITSTNTIPIESFRKTPSILYLIVPENDIERLSFFLGLTYTVYFDQFITDGLESEILPVYLFLDEFGNIGKIPSFPSVVNTMRKRKVSTTIVLQEIEQLAAIY